MIWFILIFSALTLYLSWRNRMDSLELASKVTDLKASVDALLALPAPVIPAAVDLQPLGDEIDAIKAEVDAKLAPA